MYPRSFSKWIKANKITICGKNTSTDPTPVTTPPAQSSVSHPRGRTSRQSAASQVKNPSMASIAGAAHVKMLWKKTSSTKARVINPNSGCSNQRSIRSVRRSGGSSSAPTALQTASTHAKRCTGSSLAGGHVFGWGHRHGSRSRRITWSIPTPRWPTTPTTGMPSWRAKPGMSMRPPRARTSSIMVRTRIIGRRWESSCRTKPRPRRRVVASATATTPSNSASPANLPSSTFSTIRSSGDSPRRA
ncbi:hypothetical protein HRbin30_00669 [bacterium HR30]|nr:hypothetical protein HRbin30_00669 [bacterium HR30]